MEMAKREGEKTFRYTTKAGMRSVSLTTTNNDGYFEDTGNGSTYRVRRHVTANGKDGVATELELCSVLYDAPFYLGAESAINIIRKVREVGGAEEKSEGRGDND